MRLRRCTIERFKKFDPPGIEVIFSNKATEEVADRFLILGDNASGKTTILQAIALTLSLAQRKARDVQGFGWTGFAADRLSVHGEPMVELEVEFTDDEIAATREAASQWRKSVGKRATFVEPGDSKVVRLRLEGSVVRTAGQENELFQFQGRSYVAAIARFYAPARALFHRLPGVFWYDQFRNIALSGAREEPVPDGASGEGTQAPGADIPFGASVQQLDGLLKSWYRVRQDKGPHPVRDFLGDLEKLYQGMFPGRTFAGIESVYGSGPTPTGDRFVLGDGKHTYALGEMSSGEQTVFPLLFDFVRQQIHRSVVLIDEIDLNLHPPLAQALFGLLPRLGEGNQFLVTTHSRAVSNLVSPHTIYRLPEGRPCL